MQKINTRIGEIYRFRTEYGELRCHRLNVPEGKAGELIIKVPENEKALSIEEIFVDRKFRNIGFGSRLLDFAEKTACELGIRSVELRPFSTDPLISDMELREWYCERGYTPDGEKMRKKITNRNFGVMI
jgi:GNAT superfamily N-acetyltransferase